MWSRLLLLGCLSSITNIVVDAQLFPGAACSICPTTLPEVGLPDVVLERGFAGVLTEEQTCSETEELAQSGAYSRASCVLLRTSGISNICGCQEEGQPVAPPVPVPVPVPAPIPVPVAEPTDSPEPEPTDAPEPAPTDPPEPAPTEAPEPAPTDPPIPVPTEAPIDIVVPTEAPVDVAVPTESPIPGTTVPPSMLAPSVVGVPTMVPSATMAPSGTMTPSLAAPPVTLTGAAAKVVIRLMSTSGVLTEPATETFLLVCAEFYSEYLAVPAMNVTCEIPPARRLEEAKRSNFLRAVQAQVLGPLDVTTDVMAFFDPSAGVIAFEKALIETVNNNAGIFATQLRTRGSTVSQVYYESVMGVEAFDPLSVPPAGSTPTAPIPTAPIPTAPIAAPEPVAAPIATTPTATVPAGTPMAEVENESSNGLSTGAIVGIIAGVLVGVGVFAVIGSLALKANNTPEVRQVHTDPVGADFPSPHAKPTTSAAVATSYTKEPAPKKPAVTAAVAPASVAAASVVTRDNDGNKDGMSVMTGSEMDAYSLDAGNVDQPSSAPGTKRDTADGMSQSGDEMSSHAMSSLRQNMVSRTVVAPPGKLGIVIDTTLEGPVVHKINPQSPLEGTLFPGDIIVAIDDVDTRAMSASAITALMVRTANLRRKLTVLSEDVTN